MFSRLIAVLAILSLVVGGYTHRLKAVMSSVLPAMLFAGEVMLSLALVMAAHAAYDVLAFAVLVKYPRSLDLR